MTPPVGWVTVLIVNGDTLDGRREQLWTGQYQPADGKQRYAVQVGEAGKPVLLTRRGLALMGAHIRQLIEDDLNGDEPIG